MKARLYLIIMLGLCEAVQGSNFLSQCQKPSSPEIEHTILELKKTVFTSNCQEAWERLFQKTELRLARKKIIDLEPLADLTQLRVLDLWDNQITSLKGLEKLANLTQLWIGHNKITSVEPLQNLKQLKILMLWENKVSDLRPLAKLSLTEFEVEKNPIQHCPKKSVSQKLKKACFEQQKKGAS